MMYSLWLSFSSSLLCGFKRTPGRSSHQSWNTVKEGASRTLFLLAEAWAGPWKSVGTGNTEKGTTGPTVDPTQLRRFLSPLTPVTTSSPFLWDPGIRGPFHSHGAVAQGDPTLQMFKFWLRMVRATWRECSGFRSQKPMPLESLLPVKP